MDFTINRFIYGWFVVMLVMTAISGACMLASPALFISVQRRLINLTGMPEEVFAAFSKPALLRLVGAFQLVAAVVVLYVVLVVEPDFLSN